MLEEHRALIPVDDAVIERDRQVHDLADDDLAGLLERTDLGDDLGLGLLDLPAGHPLTGAVDWADASVAPLRSGSEDVKMADWQGSNRRTMSMERR